MQPLSSLSFPFTPQGASHKKVGDKTRRNGANPPNLHALIRPLCRAVEVLAAHRSLLGRRALCLPQRVDEGVMLLRQGVEEEAGAGVHALPLLASSLAKEVEGEAEAWRACGEQLAAYAVLLCDEGGGEGVTAHALALLASMKRPPVPPLYLTVRCPAVALALIHTDVYVCDDVSASSIVSPPFLSSSAANTITITARDATGAVIDCAAEGLDVRLESGRVTDIAAGTEGVVLTYSVPEGVKSMLVHLSMFGRPLASSPRLLTVRQHLSFCGWTHVGSGCYYDSIQLICVPL